MLTSNEWVAAGLSNGSKVITKDIAYEDDMENYAFLKHTIVNFRNQCKGPANFENSNKEKLHLIFPPTDFI